MFNNIGCILRDKLNISIKTKELETKVVYPELPNRFILVLEHGRNPSTDYYIHPRLPSTEETPSQIVDISKTPAETFHIKKGTYVIVVRYLNQNWCNHLLTNKDVISGIALFMDDDLPSIINDHNLPCEYRKKLKKRFHNHIECISNLSSDLWVSCKALKEKYDYLGPSQLEPLPLRHVNHDQSNVYDTNTLGTLKSLPKKNERITYFYHGGLPHLNEAKWLQPIIKEVQERTNNLTFVIFGDHKIQSLYRHIPRVTVLERIDWETYRDFLSPYEHTIGLAPLLPSNPNHYRSHTKFFDFTRLGAIGIYTDTTTYGQFITNETDGFLLPNDHKAWVDTIIELAQSQEKRELALTNAQYRVENIQLNKHSLPIALETN